MGLGEILKELTPAAKTLAVFGGIIAILVILVASDGPVAQFCDLVMQKIMAWLPE